MFRNSPLVIRIPLRSPYSYVSFGKTTVRKGKLTPAAKVDVAKHTSNSLFRNPFSITCRSCGVRSAVWMAIRRSAEVCRLVEPSVGSENSSSCSAIPIPDACFYRRLPNSLAYWEASRRLSVKTKMGARSCLMRWLTTSRVSLGKFASVSTSSPRSCPKVTA